MNWRLLATHRWPQLPDVGEQRQRRGKAEDFVGLEVTTSLKHRAAAMAARPSRVGGARYGAPRSDDCGEADLISAIV
jgi:hypothetical protein